MTENINPVQDGHSDAGDSELQSKLHHLEKTGDSDEHDEFSDGEDEKRDLTDYSEFTKEDFVKRAEELIDLPNIREAYDIFKKIRMLFDEAVKADRAVQIREWADAGHEVRDFKPPYDELKEKFYKVYTRFLEKRAEEKRLAEEEKQKNYRAKKAIIERLKELASEDETENVFREVLDLQKKWRQIRTVPREFMQELWESYRLYLDMFYDNHAINNELKEKDRQKNLEFKIELIKKVDALHEETSIKKAHILLNKYHEEFKNTGPVPGKDVADEIWKRFKEASDHVLAEKRQQMELLRAKRNENLELKKVLCEKAEQLCELPLSTPRAWKEKGDEISALFNEWKTVGPVPESANDQIWKRFKDAQNLFSKKRREYFSKLNNEKESNLERKIALCEEAESHADSTRFDISSKKLIALQEKWKSIGPVPEAQREAIWNRFRTACDAFFKRREAYFKEKNAGEKENLAVKERIISDVLKLSEKDSPDGVFDQLRALQQEWIATGFVPIKIKNDLQQKYSKAVDTVYKKFKQSADDNKTGRLKEHFEMLSTAPGGEEKLRHEERILSDKIRSLREEVETLKNNIEFFARSKNADALRSQFDKKIDSAQQQIEKLQGELKLLRTFKKTAR